jgi:hypothetical protein
MKLFTTVTLALGASTFASGQTVIMDQIGSMDGSDLSGGITGCQDFEAAYDIYDIVTADSFTGNSDTISMVEMVLNGWNGFTDPSTVTAYTANIYTDENAAAASLTGDIATEYIDAADATQSPDWAGEGFLISVDTSMTSGVGAQLIGLIPTNDFATGGQTGTQASTLGDGTAWQANPGGGFGMPGNMQQTTADAAYRVTSDAVFDPCNTPLPTECTNDVDGDMMVSVGDVLAIIGNWGVCGDGTFRPVGDVAPLPNGDCCVGVSDVLAVIGSWGDDCTPTGGCCSADGVCTDDMTQADCEALGNSYEGDDSVCAEITCGVAYSGCPDGADSDCDDCWEDGDDSSTDCNAGLNGNGAMDPLTIGVPLCGEASVYFDPNYDNGDGTFGTTLRDTDWFSCPDLNGGGSFSLTAETENTSAIFGIVDLDASVFVEYVVVEPGQVVTYEYASFVPGNYCFWVGASDWNTDWTCANGANYWMQLDSGGAATGACCLNGSCVGENSMDECGSVGGVWHFDLTCADVNNCIPVLGACCFTDNSCLDDQSSDDCSAFGGMFAGENTLCADDVCGSVEYDQIGESDGSAIGTNITASQIFEDANAAYNIATLDNFTFDAETHLIAIEAVISGWNGFVDISPVTNYTISIYSSPDAAGADLVGDVYSIDIVTPNLPTWTGAGELVSFDIDATLPAGEYYFAVIPWNDFGVNGQTGITDYVGGLAGDGSYWQANPAGGFGFGAWQEGVGDAAYRLTVD